MKTAPVVGAILIGSLCLAASLPSQEHDSKSSVPPDPPKIQFVDIARSAGLTTKMLYGGEKTRKYIVESTGSGAAFLDYDNDGWPDIFLVNGTTLEGFPEGQEPQSRFYHNHHDGTFTDVTEKTGMRLTGWGQGVCAGDYDNDGNTDLFVTYWGHSVLLRNGASGRFVDVTKKSGLWHEDLRWQTGCAFVDYDRDGYVDLFIAHYVDYDPRELTIAANASACDWMGAPVFCGPKGMKGSHSELYHNNGDGTFTDVSEKSGVTNTGAFYCFTALTGDFDNDGWPDIYVACDSTASMLFHNKRDGTFAEVAMEAGVAFNEDGHTQAGMGIDAIDYDGDGWLDIVKTNFSSDTPTLYHNNGDGTFTDVAIRSGLGLNTKFLGWGVSFVDVDNDAWPDLWMVNGHVYPEIDSRGLGSAFREPRLLYWNTHNGKFKDVSRSSGTGVTEPFNSHGLATADFDNNGSVEMLVNNSFDMPSLLQNEGELGNWLLIQLTGVKSNRDAIGARVLLRTGGHQQLQEVRSGGSYLSQNDFRLHFGLGRATSVDSLEVHWPSGAVTKMTNVKSNQILAIKEN